MLKKLKARWNLIKPWYFPFYFIVDCFLTMGGAIILLLVAILITLLCG